MTTACCQHTSPSRGWRETKKCQKFKSESTMPIIINRINLPHHHSQRQYCNSYFFLPLPPVHQWVWGPLQSDFVADLGGDHWPDVKTETEILQGQWKKETACHIPDVSSDSQEEGPANLTGPLGHCFSLKYRNAMLKRILMTIIITMSSSRLRIATWHDTSKKGRHQLKNNDEDRDWGYPHTDVEVVVTI